MKSGMGMALLVMLLTAAFLPVGLAAAPQPSIVLTAALQSIPADSSSHPSFYITLEDGLGKPAPLTSDLNVTLSCSDTRALVLPAKVTIRAGAYYAVVNASSNILEKRTVEVSASAPGFASSLLNAVVEPPAGAPKALEVTLLPDVIMPEKGAKTLVTVTIVDSYGKPAKARSDLTVTLSSSSLQLVDLSPRTIQIKKGEYSGSTSVVSNGAIGSAIITASASNLKTDSATIKVSGAKSEKLSLWTQSSFVDGDIGLAFISVVDSGLKPAKAATDILVRLYSSNTTVLTVPSYAYVNDDNWMAVAPVTCLNPGTAKIYAMAENLASTSISVTVIDNTNPPASVRVYAVASFFPADEVEDTYVALQTVDSTGKPTRLAGATVVSVSSADSGIMDISPSCTMDQTSSVKYILATPRTAGTTKITAGTTNLPGSDVSVSVYAPVATTLTIITPPIPADGEVEACLVALSSGVPAPVSQSTLIQLSSSDTQIADVDATTVLAEKSYCTTFTLSGRSPGQISLTAIGSDLPSSSATPQVYEVRPSIFKVAYVKPLAQVQFPIVVQAVSSQGVPVVSDTPVIVNLASSNTTVITTLLGATIPAENSDVLTYGSALSEGKTVLTLSSGGFNALSVDLDSQAMKGGLKLTAIDSYRAGGSTKISAEVTLDDKPISGAMISWVGAGLYAANTTTDSKGKTENIITLREGANTIEARVTLLGLGPVTAQKTITGVRQYTLEVGSSVGTEIEGSGSYAEGAIRRITAPLTIELGGILGILGVQQVFKQWTGASESTNSTVEIVFTGESKQLALLAEYETDFMGLYLRLGIMTVVFVVVVVGLIIWKRRSE